MHIKYISNTYQIKGKKSLKNNIQTIVLKIIEVEL